MKIKLITTSLLIILCLSVSIWNFNVTRTYKIYKVVYPNILFIDLNSNRKIEEDEMVILPNIQSLQFDSKVDELLIKNYFARWIEENFYSQDVSFDSNGNVIIYGKNIEIELIKSGLVSVKEGSILRIYENSYNTKMLFRKLYHSNLVVLDKDSRVYHRVYKNCKIFSKNIEIVALNIVDINYFKQCKKCFLKQKFKYFEKLKKVYKYKFIDKCDLKDISIYFSDFVDRKKPLSDCGHLFCKLYLQEINNAKSSIDLCIYGIEDQPKIINALYQAKYRRNVKLRLIVDMDKNSNNIYKDTLPLVNMIKDYCSDNVEFGYEKKVPNSKYKNSLMHNKFMIVDKKVLITGSANLTASDLSGFNTNIILKIWNKNIIDVYQKEFDQMFEGSFHNLKAKNELHNINIDIGTKVSVYFSPKSCTINSKIIPLISSAKKYIYIPCFYITEKIFVQELIKKSRENVDIKIITDATSANNRYSYTKLLRENGILLKVENQAGKMHTKGIIIDDKFVILGSMNITKSGQSYNDENTLIFQSYKLALVAKNYFLYNWERIDDKWLYKNPRAEGFSSKNSCYDGVDNNYDGKIDSEDQGCIPKNKKYNKKI